jgi:hypothetical protein
VTSSQWQTPSARSRACRNRDGLGAPTGKISASASGDGLVWDVPNEALPTRRHRAVLHAPEGVTVIAKVAYQGARTGAFTGFEAPTLFPTTTSRRSTRSR